MICMPVLCPRCHTDQVMQGGKTTVRICNTTHRWYACRHGQRSLSMPACAHWHGYDGAGPGPALIPCLLAFPHRQ